MCSFEHRIKGKSIMLINIKGEEYKLHFGFDFLATLNALYYTKVNGVEINNGLNMGIMGLIDEDPTALVNIIMAGLSTSDRKPSKIDIQDYIVSQAEQREDGLESLMGEYLEEVKKQPLLKGKAKKLMKQMEQATKDEN